MKWIACLLLIITAGCGKSGGDNTSPPPVTPASFSFQAQRVDSVSAGFSYYGTGTQPAVRISFSDAVLRSSVAAACSFTAKSGDNVPYNVTWEHGDSTLVLKPVAPLSNLTAYTVTAGTTLLSVKNAKLQTAVALSLVTAIDTTDKFPRISDDALLTLVQQQTFKYFWDFGHPVSGLARERNTSGETVTSGGSGFGIMAIITGIERHFITRSEGLARIQKITTFLGTKAARFHGAFPHWLNGSTGAAIPFSTKDNGADLVETSYLIQGLLTARQYFKNADITETQLRNDINAICNAVEWNWFRKDNANVLYWHWSNEYKWDMNMPVKGWNECLITYILAASAQTPVPKATYDSGWANNGAIRNNNLYYDIKLPLGPALGGPLFFSHYSFLGINPKGLKDTYADYEEQVVNHTRINYAYCVANPGKNYGYGADCWGLTASDIPNGYTASSPVNDVGVIAPTAALSSFPYTPQESMRALKFFYYKLGDKIWKEYGFTDAFSLQHIWFANSFLAIDQGPVIVMIENHRSGLLWNLLMSCPEIKTGMHNLGFTSPHL
ncbi:Ig-like domain-containing protein [Chitinophaga ginsengisegetis]|uniref:glucoamylase family protein n=1 Tax=Chitinophaga ginsengisegetis TaxID=393003 RepID=UPI003441EDE2